MKTVTDPGYEITSPYLAPHQCDNLADALSTEPRSRAGARHLMRHPAVKELAMSDPLINLASRHLDAAAIPFRATLFEKSSETNWLIPWHQDTALPLANRFEKQGWGPWSAKAGVSYAHAPAWALSRVVALRIHLDSSNAENGPLRVIPGSHQLGVLSDRDVLDYVSTHEEVACVADRGAVVVMRPLIIHCSSKARGPEPRRILHVEYADSLTLGDNIHLAVA